MTCTMSKTPGQMFELVKGVKFQEIASYIVSVDGRSVNVVRWTQKDGEFVSKHHSDSFTVPEARGLWAQMCRNGFQRIQRSSR